MRLATGTVSLLVSVGVASCGEPRLECSNAAVLGTLSSMVRERARRVVEDAYPAAFDTDRLAILTRSPRISPLALRLVEWDAITGRLSCVARFVVDAPGTRVDLRERSEIEIRYRVTRDADSFFVEVGYTEMMALFPVRSEPPR